MKFKGKYKASNTVGNITKHKFYLAINISHNKSINELMDFVKQTINRDNHERGITKTIIEFTEFKITI
jgi:hypothetical protein